MILDEILFNEISPIGNSILKKTKLKSFPSTCKEMFSYLSTINTSISSEEFDGLLIGNILFSFVSSIKVRDRHTTARTFEDIFSALFSIKATDRTVRKNPPIPKSIINLDKYNDSRDTWKISQDMSSNKREKADLIINNYPISLKTLKGKAYDEHNMIPQKILDSDGKEIKNDDNNEINVGSFSFRALLKNIISNKELEKLGDRKKGLGSKSAIRANMLDPILKSKNKDKFYKRLKLFLEYVYTDDIYIVLKSNYHIIWHLIPAKTFTNCILETYKNNENKFENIWYRWENNNLRMYWKPIIESIKKNKLEYYFIDMNLIKAVQSDKIKNFKRTISNSIEKEIKDQLAKN